MISLQLLIIAAFLVSALLVFWVRVRALRAEQRTRFEAGVPATAMIVEVKTDEEAADNHNISAALRFWVEPPSGAPFKTRSPWIIDSDHLPHVRVGQTFPVRIDTLKNKVIFPNVRWAKYDWQREREVERISEDTQPI